MPPPIWPAPASAVRLVPRCLARSARYIAAGQGHVGGQVVSTAPRSLTARAREDGHLDGKCEGLREGRAQAFGCAVARVHEAIAESPCFADVLWRLAAQIEHDAWLCEELTGPAARTEAKGNRG